MTEEQIKNSQLYQMTKQVYKLNSHLDRTVQLLEKVDELFKGLAPMAEKVE